MSICHGQTFHAYRPPHGCHPYGHRKRYSSFYPRKPLHRCPDLELIENTLVTSFANQPALLHLVLNFLYSNTGKKKIVS